MAVADDLTAVVHELHLALIASGHYRALVNRATDLGFDQGGWSRVAKHAGMSESVLDAVLLGTVMPSVAQFLRVNEALRVATAPVASLNGASRG